MHFQPLPSFDNQSLVIVQLQCLHRGAESFEGLLLMLVEHVAARESDAAVTQRSQVLRGETPHGRVIHVDGMNGPSLRRSPDGFRGAGGLRALVITQNDMWNVERGTRNGERLQAIHHFVIHRAHEQPAVHAARLHHPLDFSPVTRPAHTNESE